MFTLCGIILQFPPLESFFDTGYLCRSTWYDDQDDRIKYVIATPLHTATNRHVDGPPRRFCLTLTTHEGLLKAATMTPSEPHHLLSGSSNNNNNGSPLEWIASSETCVRPYARYVTTRIAISDSRLTGFLDQFPGIDWPHTDSTRRTCLTTPTICISRRRTATEVRPVLPFSMSRQLANVLASRRPYSTRKRFFLPYRRHQLLVRLRR